MAGYLYHWEILYCRVASSSPLSHQTDTIGSLFEAVEKGDTNLVMFYIEKADYVEIKHLNDKQ